MEGRPRQRQELHSWEEEQENQRGGHLLTFISTPAQNTLCSRFLPVLTADVHRCCFVVVETFLIQLSRF